MSPPISATRFTVHIAKHTHTNVNNISSESVWNAITATVAALKEQSHGGAVINNHSTVPQRMYDDDDGDDDTTEQKDMSIFSIMKRALSSINCVCCTFFRMPFEMVFGFATFGRLFAYANKFTLANFKVILLDRVPHRVCIWFGRIFVGRINIYWFIYRYFWNLAELLGGGLVTRVLCNETTNEWV